jgi:hypothetical protein
VIGVAVGLAAAWIDLRVIRARIEPVRYVGLGAHVTGIDAPLPLPKKAVITADLLGGGEESTREDAIARIHSGGLGYRCSGEDEPHPGGGET